MSFGNKINVNVTQYEKNDNIQNKFNLLRRKSFSTTNIPAQNREFLCVPSSSFHQTNSFETLETVNKQPYPVTENLKKIASNTSLVIPEDFSFQSVRIQVYGLRWILLILCILSIAVSNMQWIQYSIITNIVMEYYDVDSVTVDWSSMIFMVVYIVCVFPISYFINIRVSAFCLILHIVIE